MPAGLLASVERLRDRGRKEPATGEAAQIQEGGKDRGVLMGRGEVYPPMLLRQVHVSERKSPSGPIHIKLSEYHDRYV